MVTCRDKSVRCWGVSEQFARFDDDAGGDVVAKTWAHAQFEASRPSLITDSLTSYVTGRDRLAPFVTYVGISEQVIFTLIRYINAIGLRFLHAMRDCEWYQRILSQKLRNNVGNRKAYRPIIVCGTTSIASVPFFGFVHDNYVLGIRDCEYDMHIFTHKF